ncbi:MAG: tetratricopeptide repeat protein, partial [Acidobacteriota bacterium]
EARAAAAMAGGRPDLAQEELRSLVGRFPGDTAARLALARAHGDQGQLAEALAVLDEARRLDPTAYETFFLLGQYSILSGGANVAVTEHLIEAQKLVRRSRDTAGEARVLNALGVGHEQLGELDRSIENFQQAAALYEKVGDVQGVAKTAFNLGNLHLRRGEYEVAERFLGDALEIQKSLGNPFEQTKVINAFGVLDEERGRYREALEHYRNALQLRRGLGDGLLLAESFMNVGLALIELGSFSDAELNLDQALARFEEAGSPFGVMLAKQRLGSCHLAQGRWSEALTVLLEGLDIARELDIPNARAVSHGLIGEVARLQGRFAAAYESFGEALALLGELGDVRGQVEFTLARVEAHLDLADADAATADLDQAGAWLADGGGHAQLSALHRLRGRLAAQHGEVDAARGHLLEAVAEAEKSGAAVVELEARVAAAEGAAALNDLWRDVDVLGHTPLQLQCAEKLVRARLADGETASVDDVLRRAQSLVRSIGTYAFTYRLHLLTADVRRARGDEAGAVRAEAAARAEVERLVRAMPDDRRDAFLDRDELVRIEVSPARPDA